MHEGVGSISSTIKNTMMSMQNEMLVPKRMKSVICSNMINLVNIMLSEISHILNDQYCMLCSYAEAKKFILMSNDF